MDAERPSRVASGGQRFAVTLWASADLGTNTFRLLIAEELELGELSFRELRQQVVRLGEGLAAGGRLQAPALARAETLLRQFRDRLDRLGVERRVGAVTAAGREAENGEEFLSSASGLLGAQLRILAGEEEARLSARGARSLANLGGADLLFLDIGGGSTEVVAERRGSSPVALSVPTGVVKLQEARAVHDPPAPSDLRRLEESAREAWHVVLSAVDSRAWRRALREGRAVLLATAGTPLTVAAQVTGRDVSDTRRLNGTRVSRQELDLVWDRFCALTAAERARLPAVEPGREDVILAGLALLRSFAHAFGAPGFTASDGGLLEGVLLDAVERERGDAAWAA